MPLRRALDTTAGAPTVHALAVDGSKPIVICENGLGSPLESWDWIEEELCEDFPVLRYHRRGYARTKSRLRPAQLLETLLREIAPGRPIIFLSHSIGALIAANAINESEELRDRVVGLYMLDGTDARLLKASRDSPPSIGQYRQMTMQEMLASVTGLNRWTVSKIERDVEYRPDIQRSYLVTSGGVRTLLSAQAEYLQEPLNGQEQLVDFQIALHVLAAADKVQQQENLAQHLGASFGVIDGSAHRSIIGRFHCAREVVRQVREKYK